MKALVSLSFDDGRVDNYTIAYPILKTYSLPATFNITTGFVEGKFGNPNGLTMSAPMTIEQLLDMQEDPLIEIAGHGYMHRNTIEDIILGVDSLKNHFINCKKHNNIWGFASPGTALDLNYYRKNREKMKQHGIVYTRLSLRYLSYPRIKSLVRKMSRVIPHPFFYKLAYKDTLMDRVEEDLIYSVPVLSSITVSELMSLVRMAIKKNKLLVLMFHSIMEEDNMRDCWDYSTDKFRLLCKSIADLRDEGQLDVVTTMEAYNLIKN